MTDVELVTWHRPGRRTAVEPVLAGFVRFGTPIVTAEPGTFELPVELNVGAADLVAAFVRVDFGTAAVTVTELSVPESSTSDSQTSVSVLRGGMFGWLLGDPLGTTTVRNTFTAYARLSAPSGTSPLTVTARVDATVVRAGGMRRRPQRLHARCAIPVEFAVTLPDGGPPPAAPARPSDQRAGSVRLCMAADIQRFHRFLAPEARRAQERFVATLADARRYAGIDEPACDLQESGDGQFAVLPHGLDESTVVPRLIEGLRIALAQINADLNEHARLRLRVALHRGQMMPGANGWIGESSIAIHRILDSEPVRNALVTDESADFALIVPEVLYREIVCQRYEWLDPDEFTHVEVAFPAKDFTADAWVYVPDR